MFCFHFPSLANQYENFTVINSLGYKIIRLSRKFPRFSVKFTIRECGKSQKSKFYHLSTIICTFLRSFQATTKTLSIRSNLAAHVLIIRSILSYDREKQYEFQLCYVINFTILTNLDCLCHCSVRLICT